MKKNNYRIIGVDFDGTLAITEGTYPEIQGPIQEVIDYVLWQQKQGAYIVLVTMRENEELTQAVEWCKEQGLEFDTVNNNLLFMQEYFANNPRKIFCNEYIDDRNIGGLDLILQEIRKTKGE